MYFGRSLTTSGAHAIGTRSNVNHDRQRNVAPPVKFTSCRKIDCRIMAIVMGATLVLGLPQTRAHAQEGADELARKLANPVASLISVPFQYNIDFGLGPEDGTLHRLNVQPVIPASLSGQWSLITRIVAPVIYQDDVFGASGSQSGLGDITTSFFLSPKEPTAGGWILGGGSVVLLPTATDSLLGAKKWGAGPTAVAIKQTPGGWTYGGLANHIWSFAGDSDRNDISATFLQPTLARQFPGGRTVSANLEATYDWQGSDWTIPANLTYSQVARIGQQMLSFQGGCATTSPLRTAGPTGACVLP